MKVKRVHAKKLIGGIPDLGDLFAVCKSETVYIRVENPYQGELGISHIFGASLTTGRIHRLAVDTNKRFGFILLEPENGVLNVVKTNQVSQNV